MPWARLHAAKDYVHMAELVADFPAIHCTFNFVPSLVDQLAGIGEGRYIDAWQVLSLKESWSDPDRQFILQQFFSIHPRLLERYPAFVRLRDRRHDPDLGEQYFVDLVAWFNLAWIDPRAIARDGILRELGQKAEWFSRADIAAIIAKQRELAAHVIPLHRDLAQRGQIEIALSPYYHPILPLLIDQRSAREALPKVSLPATLYAHPEDASEQIRRAVDAHRRYFGLEPHGMWPSEGSVSDGLVSLLGNGLRWLASDEDVLARSLGVSITRDGGGNVTNPRVLYQPYMFTKMAPRGAKPLASTAMVFRDHVISDRIGFAYQYMSAHDAVQEFMYRLHRIYELIADKERAYLVSIILDGENAWESYEDNGDAFFRELYGALSSDSSIRTVTLSEYLQANPPRQKLSRLAAGSWINGNFDTWIGEPAQNLAWDLLAQTRQALGDWQRDYALADEEVMSRAWDELYIAQGSDWFWWYSNRNNSTQNAMFDELFRGHLQNVYTVIGMPVPDELKEPIYKAAQQEQECGVTAYVSPRLGADERAGDEWAGAGMIAPQTSTGTMQQASIHLARLYFGYSESDLFFRIEGHVDLSPYRVALYLEVPRANRNNTRPRYTESESWLALSYEIALEKGQNTGLVYRADGQGVWKLTTISPRVARQGRVVEIGISRKDLGVDLNDTLGALVTLSQDQRLLEKLPQEGAQHFAVSELK